MELAPILIPGVMLRQAQLSAVLLQELIRSPLPILTIVLPPVLMLLPSRLPVSPLPAMEPMFPALAAAMEVLQ